MIKRSFFDALFDRPPERLENGCCADCQFLGTRTNIKTNEWSQRLYKACDWHLRHSGPWGPDYTFKKIT